LKNTYKESDLYAPLKKYFTEKEFEVKGEVKNCDLVAVKDDIMIVVEMKLTFSLKLVYQALDRTKITNFVYICIPRPKNIKKTKDMLKLLKKLNLGLIYVSLDSPLKDVQVVLEVDGQTKKNKRSRLVLGEFYNRSFDNNAGGINKTKIFTAYTEQSIKIACILHNHGEQSAKLLIKNFGCAENTSSILYKNFYGWFERCEKRGIYKLSEKGADALKDEKIKNIVDVYLKL